MNCEICGSEIPGPAFKVRVEGAKMLVCNNCRKLGQPYQDEIPVARQRRMLSSPRILRVPRNVSELPKEMEEFEVAEDYSKLVLRKRMKLGLSQEELAQRVKEKLSVIQKIELGKVAPNTKLCRGLQHELKIKLLIPRKEVVAPKPAALTEVTLGDIIHIKGKTQPGITD